MLPLRWTSLPVTWPALAMLRSLAVVQARSMSTRRRAAAAVLLAHPMLEASVIGPTLAVIRECLSAPLHFHGTDSAAAMLLEHVPC